MANIIIMISVPIYMISFLYFFVLYGNSIPKTFIYYFWQTVLMAMILLPMIIISNIPVLAKKDKKDLRR